MLSVTTPDIALSNFVHEPTILIVLVCAASDNVLSVVIYPLYTVGAVRLAAAVVGVRVRLRLALTVMVIVFAVVTIEGKNRDIVLPIKSPIWTVAATPWIVTSRRV